MEAKRLDTGTGDDIGEQTGHVEDGLLAQVQPCKNEHVNFESL